MGTKPPFQTFEQIERQVARGGLSEFEKEELWDCLFLTLPEVEEVLAWVKEKAIDPFVYPMFVMAAHTGARRSELLRCKVSVFEFDSGIVRIHDRKRVRGKRTTRSVPISPLLLNVMQAWFGRHHDNGYAFHRDSAESDPGEGVHRRKALTPDAVVHWFGRTVTGSKFEKMRGWHVFRHSFASNCAMKGVDQRIINEWMGHQTEEMVRRYRHLFPDSQRAAMQFVFGRK